MEGLIPREGMSPEHQRVLLLIFTRVAGKQFNFDPITGCNTISGPDGTYSYFPVEP